VPQDLPQEGLQAPHPLRFEALAAKPLRGAILEHLQHRPRWGIQGDLAKQFGHGALFRSAAMDDFPRVDDPSGGTVHRRPEDTAHLIPAAAMIPALHVDTLHGQFGLQHFR
jgi:hypothetical protein